MKAQAVTSTEQKSSTWATWARQMDHRENQPDRLSRHWLDSTDCEKLPLLTNLWKKSGVKQGEGLGKVQPHPPGKC